MVNNFKPYDPNDDSERSSAESYLPPKKTAPKIDSSSQSFPEFPEELERDNYVPPVTPNPTKNKIIEESEKIQEEVDSIIKEKETPYVRSIINPEPEYEFTDPVFSEYRKGEEEIREAVSISEDNIQGKAKDFQDWNESYSGDYNSYESQYDSKLKAFQKIEEDHNNLVRNYNSFIEGNFPYIQEKEKMYLSQLDLADKKLKKLESQWDSASQEVPFEITGVDYGSSTEKRPDWQVPTPSPDFSSSGRDNTDKIEDVIGDHMAINFGGSGRDYSSNLQKQPEATLKPLVFDDMKKDERFVEALGDRNTGTFSRIAPSPKDKKPVDVNEYVDGRKLPDLFLEPLVYEPEGISASDLNPFDPNTDPLTRSQASQELMDKMKKEIPETLDSAVKDYGNDVKSWVRNFSDNFVGLRVGSGKMTSPPISLGDITLINPVLNVSQKVGGLLFEDFINEAKRVPSYVKDEASKTISSSWEEIKGEEFSVSDLKNIYKLPVDVVQRLDSAKNFIGKGFVQGISKEEAIKVPFASLMFNSEEVTQGLSKDFKDQFNKVKGNYEGLGIIQRANETVSTIINDYKKTKQAQKRFDEEYLQLGSSDPYTEAYYRLTPEQRKEANDSTRTEFEKLFFETGRQAVRRLWKPVDTVSTALILKSVVTRTGKVSWKLASSKEAQVVSKSIAQPIMTKASGMGDLIKNKLAPIKTGQYKMFDSEAQEVIGARVIHPRLSYQEIKDIDENLMGWNPKQKVYDASSYRTNFAVLEIERELLPSMKKFFQKRKDIPSQNIKALPLGKDIDPVIKKIMDDPNALMYKLDDNKFYNIESDAINTIINPHLSQTRTRVEKAMKNILNDNKKLSEIVGKDVASALRVFDNTIDNYTSLKGQPSYISQKKAVKEFMDEKALKIIVDPTVKSQFTKKEFNKILKSYSKNVNPKEYDYLYSLFKEAGEYVTSKSKTITNNISENFSNIVYGDSLITGAKKPKALDRDFKELFAPPVRFDDVAKQWDKNFSHYKETRDLIKVIDEAVGGYKSPEKISTEALERKIKSDPIFKNAYLKRDIEVFDDKVFNNWKIKEVKDGKPVLIFDDSKSQELIRNILRRSQIDDSNRINYFGNTVERATIDTLYKQDLMTALGLINRGHKFTKKELEILDTMLAYVRKALPVAKSDRGLITGAKKSKGIQTYIPSPFNIGGIGMARMNITAPNFNKIINNLKTTIDPKIETKLLSDSQQKKLIANAIKTTTKDIPSPEDVLKRYGANKLNPSKLNSKLKGVASLEMDQPDSSNSLPMYEDLKAYTEAIKESKSLKTKIKLLEKPRESVLTPSPKKTTIITPQSKKVTLKTTTTIPQTMPLTTETPERLKMKQFSTLKPKMKTMEKIQTKTLIKSKVKTPTKSKVKIQEKVKTNIGSKAKTKAIPKIKIKPVTKTPVKVKVPEGTKTPKPSGVTPTPKPPPKKPRANLPKLPSSKSEAKDKKTVSSVTKVGWKQGKVYPVVNISKGLVRYFKKKPQGIKSGSSPRETFSILERRNVPKRKAKTLSMGRFDVSINGDVSFKLKRKRVLPFEALEKKNKLRRK